MKISYNWLRKYVDTNLSAEELGKILTDTGLEVEGVDKIEAIKGGLEGVVIGEVLSCVQHPDADKLKVTTINTGSEELQIVCGAPNVAAGQKVVVATIGTTLYPNPDEPFKIKKSKIRGVESHGMLCAEDELGMGQSHDGILVLDPQAKIGTPAAEYFELEDDYELEIGLTPNRADAMGHIGVARDVIAYLNVHQNKNLELNIPSLQDFAVANNSNTVAIKVEDAELCPKYCGLTISGVEVKASPAWLQKRLRAVGLSPINNVVDVTNFVMRELGTPLHAFDCAALNRNIVVKTAKSGEVFKTLDEVDRKLDESNLMITNGSENLCIAGVFGGCDSGIKDNTKDVFLESAYFNPVSVRKTAKMHGLSTDASFRFERGVDPSLTEYALKRAALLIQEVAGGQITMEPTIVGDGVPQWREVAFNIERCNRLIGTDIDPQTIENILENLDIEILNKNGSQLMLKVPTYRVDVEREADVIEEILRIYGFNNVPLPEQMKLSINLFEKPDPEKVQNTIAEFLTGKGFVETLNNSLTTSKYIKEVDSDVLKAEYNVELLNPLSLELDVMRQSLVFNALEVIQHNQNRQNPNLRIFEFGKVYQKFESGYNENKRLLIAITGDKEAENWNNSKDKVSFYTLKGIVNAVMQRMGLDSLIAEKAIQKRITIDGIQLNVLKNKVGEIGWISSKMKKQFGIKNDVFIADLDWDAILTSLKMVKIKYQELPKTFEVRRDFSLLLDSKTQFAEIEAIAQKVDRKLLKEVGLFDVYEGKNLPEGKKSYAVSFKFQDAEKTLKDQQIDGLMDRIRKELESNLGAQLR